MKNNKTNDKNKNNIDIDDNIINISKFKISDLPAESGGISIILTGATNSGKNVCAHNLIYSMYKKLKIKHRTAYLFSSTAFIQPDSFSFIKNRYETFDSDFVMNIINKQKKELLRRLKNGEPKFKILEDLRCLMVIDDLSFGNRSSKSGAQGFSQNNGVIELLITQNRHLGIDFLMLTQAVKATLSSKVRKNVMVVVFFPSMSKNATDVLINEFGLANYFSVREARSIVSKIFASRDFISIVALNFRKNKKSFKDLLRWYISEMVSEKDLKKIKFTEKKKKKNNNNESESDSDSDSDDNFIFRNKINTLIY